MSFNQYLAERYVNIFDSKKKAEVINTVWELLELTYASCGGLMSMDKNNLVTTPGVWKLVRRNEKITAGILYRDTLLGRKIRVVFHNGTPEGKDDVKSIIREDIKRNRAYGEVSGALEKVMLKLGGTPIKNNRVASVLEVESSTIKRHSDGVHYDRELENGVVVTNQTIIGNI